MKKHKEKRKLPPPEDPLASSPVIRWLFDIDADDEGPGECLENGYLLTEEMWPAIKYAALNWEWLASGKPLKVHNKALWRTIGNPLFVGMFYIGLEVHPVAEKIEMIEALKHVTLSIPALHDDGEPMETGYFMLWDMVAPECTEPATADACFEVLKELLWNLDERIQYAALHGLGHLNHPSRPALVTEFIRRVDSKLTPEGHLWLEQCRDGTVM